MQIPASLQRALERLIATQSATALERVAATISARYRETGTYSISTALEAIAYAAWRMPATFAAMRSVFQRLAEHLPDFAPARLLDIGAGSGAAIWAAAAQWPALTEVIAIEREPAMAHIGEQLARAGDLPPIIWQRRDVLTMETFPASDLVVVGYVYGEIDPAARARLLQRLWAATTGVLALVEPGTPAGHAAILSAREALRERQAMIVAPCPHAGPCPMADNDWCHVAQRVARPAFQRRLKGAAAPFEDEKYAYLIVSRQAISPYDGRIVRHPITHRGRIELQVCAASGLQHVAVTRSQATLWRRARASSWGDVWPGGDEIEAEC